MDMITFAMLNGLKKSGGVGHVEPGMVLTFDGNTTGKETFVDADMGFSLVKISDKVYDLSKVNKVVVTATKTGETTAFTPTVIKSPGVSMLDDNGQIVFAIASDGTNEEVSFLPSIGTWVSFTDEAYVSRLEFAETIHPIDPKFLPGVCLPVVEITSAVYDGSANAVLTEGESAELDSACASSTHVIVNVPIYEGVPGYPVLCRVMKMDGAVLLMGMIGSAEFIADKNEDGLWKIGG